MKNYLLLLIVGLCFLANGCNRKGVPVEYANMCDLANNHTTIEVVGYLVNDGSVTCSNSADGESIKCGIRFQDSLSSKTFSMAKITKRSWSSEIENIEGEGLKIRDITANLL